MKKPDMKLSAKQYQLIEQHAAALPPAERPSYMHSVVSNLCDEPSDHAVSITCNRILDMRPAFMLADTH
jgi:hypothetical protein